MSLGFYEFAVDALPARPVRRARLLLGLWLSDEYIGVVLDADRDEFVRVPALPPGRDWHLFGLTPDGGDLLLLAAHFGRRLDGLCLHTLATGQQQWFNANADGRDVLAAASPDGHTIATLSIPSWRAPERPDDPAVDLAVVSVIDAPTGYRRRLWFTPGGHSYESALAWSPDGRLVAATYLDIDNDIPTVVVDTDGTIVGRHPDTSILPSPNSAWLTNRELICRFETDAGSWLSILDVQEGRHRVLRKWAGPPLAHIGTRLVTYADPEPDPHGPLRLSTITFDGAEPQAFITIHPNCGLLRFDTSNIATEG